MSLIEIKEVTNSKYGKRRFLYRCDCGHTTTHTKQYVTVNSSCGCESKKRASKLGISRTKNGDASNYNKRPTPEYNTWIGMKQRCYNPNTIRYKFYGGRGIEVCDRWLNSYETFLSDMGRKPGKRYSIDRTNNNGNYEPSNCYWATDKQQRHNRGF